LFYKINGKTKQFKILKKRVNKMGLKRVTTKEGEVYFIDEKNGERVITGLEVGKTEQGTGNGEQENKNLSMDKTIKYTRVFTSYH